MKHESYGLTDRGRVRRENQDAILTDPELGVYGVSDGCGGHLGGEVASRMALAEAHKVLQERRATLEAYASSPTARRRLNALALISSAVNTASVRIHAVARAEPDKAGMGATIALLAVMGERAAAAHAGDSRLYLFRQGAVHQLTEDHTLARRYVRMGLMSQRDAEESPFARIITRAVGFHQNTHVETLHFELVEGDLMMLCSDGLCRHVADGRIAELCDSTPPERLPRALIDAANAGGGEDNISTVVVKIPDGRSRRGEDVLRQLRTLRRVLLFKHLSYAELLRVLDICQVESYEPGNRILAEGDPSDRFYILLNGAVEVVKGRRVLAKLPSGALFGEMGLIDAAPRSAHVLAPQGARVLVILRDDFFCLLRREMTLAVKVLWGLSKVLNHRLRATSRELAALGGTPPITAPAARSKLEELADAIRPFV